MPETPETRIDREGVLRVMSAASFLIFVQAYIVAPLIPAFVREFHASTSTLGLLVPAYMLPYGVSTLFYGPLSDRIGRKPVILTLLALTIVTTAGAATASNVSEILVWRALNGITTGGIIPITIALMADLFPYAQRGRAIGWLFGSIAGGMAFGSTLGAMLNPFIGWRMEFLLTAAFSAIVFIFAFRLRHSFEGQISSHPLGFWQVITGYVSLFANQRAAKVYFYIFANSMFHSGVFSWLGLYLSERYHLGDEGIGLALLGYGIPGMFLGPVIGHVADRTGRRRIIPLGFFIAAISGAAFIPASPWLWPGLIAATLSLGYDMSHPLLAGIITSVNPTRRGLAMGMNAFVLFTGFGLGALAFGGLLRWGGFTTALAVFAAVQLALALLAIFVFQGEDSTVGDHSGASR